ncbi:hypothetical protein LguiA_028432 [Lonicera macranthoides]
MAHVSHLPCDADGICMLCKTKPSDEDKLTCNTCVTPWHVSCLSVRPETLASTLQWECPDCTTLVGAQVVPAGGNGVSDDLLNAIRAIEADTSLTERQKAKRRQELLSGQSGSPDRDGEKTDKGKEKVGGGNDVLELLDENFKCSFCMQLPERPVTTPCGHNFCLKCFQKWIKEGKRTCAKCRRSIPPKMASQPRINSTLVEAIRMARMSKSIAAGGPQKIYHFMHDQNRPDKAFTTERAKKAGMANAASGRIFVTVPQDHFGPILAENDPERKQGVLVGECWELRMECRQWGIHYPPVAGIAGQSEYGAQSVVLSGGYEDDEDHGEWFLYTGSGGRDLSGNKRTNKAQSFDQKFESYNEALRVSCNKGYPVRVVRSHKEKRSAYAPEKGLRYDGIYRIEKCWRKVGKQGFKVCRYLFVRCDNDPAPWTSDEHGDRPRPLPKIPELKKAIEISERTEPPSWGYDEEKESWVWKKPPPPSRKQVTTGNPEERKRVRREIKSAQYMSVKEKLLKEFSCLLCKNVMTLPLTTPCAHNFCKPCLEAKFSGKTFTRDRTCQGGRTLRAQKNTMDCPACSHDISEFLQNPQVNRELMDVIEKLQSGSEECKNIIEKSTLDDEVHASERCSDDLSLREENDLSNSQANGKTEEGGCKRKETETPTKEKPNTKRKKSEPKDGLSKAEENGEEQNISVENELSNSQADGKTEGGCKRKETEYNMPTEQKTKRTSKRKKSEPKDDLSKVDENAEGEKTSEVKVEDDLSKAEENGEELKISVENDLSNSQADGKTEEGGCKRKETENNMPTEQKPKRTSKRKKSDPKDDLSKVDEKAEGEKTSEVKVDDGYKLEAPAVKSCAKKASPVSEKTEGGARRSRPPKGGVKTNNKKDQDAQDAQNGI